MNCPQCRSEETSVKRTADAGDTVSRLRLCGGCGGRWWTDEQARRGTFVHASARNDMGVTGATGAAKPPPIAETNPSARTYSAGGVGGALPSGSDLGPISIPDPSQQSPQDLPRAELAGLWTVYDWRRKYGLRWCEKYGGTAIGGDGEADGKLREQLDGLPVGDRMAAQARAQAMFTEFLAEAGEPAKARHRWAFFVGRFQALRVPMAAAGPRAGETGYREFA